MVLNEALTVRICLFILVCSHNVGVSEVTQDQTTRRTNTLSDDADDIQRQLDNEARDRLRYGQPKAVWVFHFPAAPLPLSKRSLEDEEYEIRKPNSRHPRQDSDQCCQKEHPPNPDWDYPTQMKWHESFPACKGYSQSPVDLPVAGLIKTRGARPIMFCNYDSEPKSMGLQHDGNRVIISGEWEKEHWPLVYGGAAHSRRYLFHSLTVHAPSEHPVGGVFYPMEMQALHVSADYASFDEAVKASARDKQAFLGIITIYQYESKTHSGLKQILKAIACSINNPYNCSVDQRPLGHFSPPLKSYACYQGSIPYPPCTETVLWLVRARTLGITREDSDNVQNVLRQSVKLFNRVAQPLNDRKIYYFH